MASKKPEKPTAKTNMTVRIQSRDGMKRLELSGNETLQHLITKVKTEFGLPTNNWTLFRDRNKKEPIKPGASRLSTANIKHGDLLYLDYVDGSIANSPAGPSRKATTTDSSLAAAVEPMQLDEKPSFTSQRPAEDEVDHYLDKQEGLIQRERDPKMCHHSSTAKCSHCLPIDPFDEEYLKQRDIKHMSFHAYIRKLVGVLHGRSTASKYPLENIVCRIKPGCTTHAPWPDGICTKCQPNPVTLNRQRYRHVDNIVFENPLLVNRFLDFWRQSGHQRIGILLGRYEAHADVPLGIKCIVSAIYEPPQTSTDRSVRMQSPLIANTAPFDRRKQKQSGADEWRELHQLVDLSASLGLRPVGWIFTDLLADKKTPGLVQYTRHAETHFLSAEECVTAACFQCKFPNVCKYAIEGYFGSKFVTVVVSGGEDKQVHFSGYQVSNQCEALVRDNCLVPTRDAPELAWVRESTPQQYVPDVTFMEKDEYGNDVSKTGRPLPVEYLIVDVPCGVPLEEQYTFHVDAKLQPFVVENRTELGQFQTFDAACTYASQFTKDQFFEMISDFHFLNYLVTNQTFPFTMEQLKPIIEAIKSKDRIRAFDWSQTSDHWGNFVQLMTAHATDGAAASSGSRIAPARVQQAVQGGQGADGGRVSAGGVFPCQHCTYLNPAATGDCVLCGLPVA